MPVQPQFIINLKGKQFVLLGGLLDLAHQNGLRSIETELIDAFCQPSEKNFVVRAIGRFRTAEGDDAIWSAYGDASPANSQMRGAELRHAETRAIARMLRHATNVGITAFEELGPDADEERPAGPPQASARPTPPTPANPLGVAVAVPICATDGCGVVLTQAQSQLAQKKFGRPLCLTHQKAAAVAT